MSKASEWAARMHEHRQRLMWQRHELRASEIAAEEALTNMPPDLELKGVARVGQNGELAIGSKDPIWLTPEVAVELAGLILDVYLTREQRLAYASRII